MHAIDAIDDKMDSLLQSNPEPGHPFIGDSNDIVFPLLKKERDNAAPTAGNIAIPDTAKPSLSPPSINISLNKEPFHDQFSCPIKVNWLDRFIAAYGYHPLNTVINGSIDNIDRPVNICPHRFNWVVFTGWHLFQSCGMDDDINAVHGSIYSVPVPHITNEEAQSGIIVELLPHFLLEQFSPREYPYHLWITFFQSYLGKLLAKRTCATGYEDYFTF
jgi:hypothetical protein